MYIQGLPITTFHLNIWLNNEFFDKTTETGRFLILEDILYIVWMQMIDGLNLVISTELKSINICFSDDRIIKHNIGYSSDENLHYAYLVLTKTELLFFLFFYWPADKRQTLEVENCAGKGFTRSYLLTCGPVGSRTHGLPHEKRTYLTPHHGDNISGSSLFRRHFDWTMLFAVFGRTHLAHGSQ